MWIIPKNHPQFSRFVLVTLESSEIMKLILYDNEHKEVTDEI